MLVQMQKVVARGFLGLTVGLLSQTSLIQSALAQEGEASPDDTLLNEEAPPAEPAPAPAAAPAAAPAESAAPAAESSPAPEGEGKQANNTVYFEIGGPGVIYSITYERHLVAGLNLRVGGGGAAFQGGGYAVFPVGLNYMGIGGKKHHLELGMTANIWVGGGGGVAASGVVLSPLAGYRLQPFEGGFNFRAGLSPFVFAGGRGGSGSGFIPMPYVSFGASF
jgi:hypothetical protein